MDEIGILFFLAGLAIVVTIIHILLKQAGREEYAYLVLVLGITIALIKVIPMIMDLFQQVESVFYLY